MNLFSRYLSYDFACAVSLVMTMMVMMERKMMDVDTPCCMSLVRSDYDAVWNDKNLPFMIIKAELHMTICSIWHWLGRMILGSEWQRNEEWLIIVRFFSRWQNVPLVATLQKTIVNGLCRDTIWPTYRNQKMAMFSEDEINGPSNHEED